MSASKIGVVGLGSMGMGMARNALKAGLDVRGFDLSEDVRTNFRDAGGTVVSGVAEAAAGVDVLLLTVVDAEQARSVLFGESGAASAADPNTVVMISCTIAPRDVREMSSKLEECGLLVLDAPVSGGRVGAETGALKIMASGSARAFDKSRPLLNAICSKLYEVGNEPGLGATYKVVHQLAAGVHLAAAAEVMALGARMGCDASLLYDIVSKSSGQSWMFDDRVPRMLSDEETPASTVDIFVKDLGLVLDAGFDTRTPLPIAAAAHQLLLAASSMGHGQIDDSAVVKVYESATGVPVATGKGVD